MTAGEGAALVLATGESFALKAGQNLVGRKDGEAGVDIDLEPFDPDKYTSRKQCLLSLEGGRIFVTDLSSNGTWLQGVRLEKGMRIEASSGSAIRFVGVEARLRF